ncbi:MAG: hypothetical protein N2595_10110 [bacterium]|nr:hypothetical protein [bacterium]
MTVIPRHFNWLLLPTLLFGLAAGWLAAQSTNPPPATLTVRAGRMEYFPEQRYFVCAEDVVVTISNVTLRADRVMAYQNTEGTPDPQEFTRIVASGNVRVHVGNRTVRGQHAEWTSASKAIRITGNPVARERGGREICSDAIQYDLVREKLSFEGRMQLRAVITEDLKRDYRQFKGL